VEFIGEHSQFEELASLFQAMAVKEKKEKWGQLPPFVTEGGNGYFFETVWADGILYYETKWAPNTGVLVRIAKEFKVGFTHSYSEPGNGVFGETSYLDGTRTAVDLGADELAQYEYNEENGMYRFENHSYESSEDILLLLLERRKAAQRQQDLNPNENDLLTNI
jgi:hypothetical protein